MISTFVLNHFGMPNITDDTFERWARDIKAISALSHVYIKLSGIPNFCQEGAEHSIVLRRWFDRVLECLVLNGLYGAAFGQR